MSIVVEGLCKSFGHRQVVVDVSLSIQPGEIYGLIGPNGAGKTTSMRMLAGLLRPTAGRALICGCDVAREPELAKSQLGFLTASTGLYERLTPMELLNYYAELFGLESGRRRQRIDQLARELQMRHLLRRRCGGLSTGEQQRVSLARASVHDPLVLIFDEPTAGLDVLASRFVADFIRAQRDRRRTVLFSTHYMTEAELLCDRIGLLHRGRLLAEGAPAAIKQQFGAGSLEQVFLDLNAVDGEIG